MAKTLIEAAREELAKAGMIGVEPDEQNLQQLLVGDPENLPGLHMLGVLYLSRNDLRRAIDCLARAADLAAGDAEAAALNDLAVAYRRCKSSEQALPLVERSLQINPRNGFAHYNYAGICQTLGYLDKAIEHFERAAELSPALETDALAQKASVLERQGRADEAFAIVKELINAGQSSYALAMALGTLVAEHPAYDANLDAAATLLEQAFHRRQLLPAEYPDLFFKLGQVHQKRKDFAKAFECFEAAHQHAQISFDEPFFRLRIDSTKAAFSSRRADTVAAGKGEAAGIFIVGLPRSGSTLIEQIFSMNRQLAVLEETTFFHQAVSSVLPDREDIGHWGGGQLEGDEVAAVRRGYLERVEPLLAGRPQFSDKTLSNLFYVGQILQAFPEARILWARRDPRDACLSCYTYNFTGVHAYCHDLKSLAHYANGVEELMQFWRQRFPEQVHVVQYEALISQPETTVREMVAFCGLPWDEAYLRFHESSRRAMTASYNQVTRPLYASAIGRWRAYEAQLAPLLEELDLSDAS